MEIKRKCQPIWRRITHRWKGSLAAITCPSWRSGASALPPKHSWRLQTNFILSTAWRTRKRWRRKWRPNLPASDEGTSRLAFLGSPMARFRMKMPITRMRKLLDKHKTGTKISCNFLANKPIWSTWKCIRMRTCLVMMSPRPSWIVSTRSLMTMRNPHTSPKEPGASRLQQLESSAWKRR